jgi:hypothetical protein
MNWRFGRRVSFSFRARNLWPLLLLAALSIGACQSSLAQGAPGSAAVISTLFQGVRIFDGKSAALSAPSNVLISGNIIERVSASPITIDAKANVQVIPGNDRRALARDVGADDAGTGVR